MSTTMLKGIAVAAALTVGSLTLVTPAEAGKSSRNLAAGALIGLGAAAIIAGSSRRRHRDYSYEPRYYSPPPVAYVPPPAAYEPPPAYSYGPRPWSTAWYNYCRRKYRSFDPRSGTFQPYYGPRQLCQ